MSSPAPEAGTVAVREAEPGDVDLIHSLIVELAEYERAPEQVTGTPQMLERALFGEHPSAEALIAELDGRAVGFALFHGTFSTWECRAGIWLEDLYVPPQLRRARGRRRVAGARGPGGGGARLRAPGVARPGLE